MCQHFELVRAFILHSHKLYKGGVYLQEIGPELESIQRGYLWELDIIFLKEGGFAICLPAEMPAEQLLDATAYLRDFLVEPPRLMNLAQLT